jgi:hypothetical protein
MLIALKIKMTETKEKVKAPDVSHRSRQPLLKFASFPDL